MAKSQGSSKGLTLADILITIVVAVVFGIVYKVWGPMYDVLKPLGFQLEQLSYGMWFIASTFAFLLIRKPGVAILAELAASVIEMFLGGEWGVSTLVYGILQGVGAEIMFALFRYRKTGLGVTMLASIGSAVISLAVDQYYGYIDKLTFWNYCLFIGFRLLGSAVLAGVVGYLLAAAMEKTGVLNLIRPASSKDYESLG